MKKLQYWFRYIGSLGLTCLTLLLMPAVGSGQMPLPSGNQALAVPYYCPVGDPVPNDNPSLSKPIGLGPVATGGNTLNPSIDVDFMGWVDLYVAASAYSDPTDLWLLGPDGQFRLFTSKEDIEPSLSASGVRTMLFGADVPTAGLPVDTYYLYLMATPSGEPLSDQTPYYLWTTSFSVLPPYFTMSPSCLQMESTVGVERTQLVTISNPDDSTRYTISSVTAGGEGFSIQNNNCGDMPGGSSCNFTISFNPSSEGVHNVDLSIGIDGYQSNAADPQEAAQAPPPFISIPIVGVGKEAVSCVPTLSSSGQVFDYNGAGDDTFQVNYSDGCSGNWTVTTVCDASTCSWIHLTTLSGSGNGTVHYEVDQYDGTSQRVGTIMVDGQTFTVKQNPKSSGTPGTCTYSISPTTKTFGAAGGTGTFQLTTQSGCEWLATGGLTSTWLSVTSSRSGTGNATISYSADQNFSSKGRTGYITVEGQTFTVTQAGTNCSYTLSPQGATVASGGGGSFNINVSSSSCGQPSVLPSDSWIHVSGINSVTGGYKVTYTTDANSGSAARTSYITVNGTLNFSITESASGGTVPSCTYSLTDPDTNQTSKSFTTDGGTGSFSVTVSGSGCSWSASSSSWITVTSPTSTQTTSGAVTYSVPANTGSSRSGYISVNGQTFSIIQDGSTPTQTSLTYTTLPGFNQWFTYSLSGRSSSTTSPEMGRNAMFFKVNIPASGCPQTEKLSFVLGGLRANVNMLIADPDHPFADLDSAFELYNGFLLPQFALGPPYWYKFSGGANVESDYVTNANSYSGRTFYVMFVNEDTTSTSFRFQTSCN